MKTRIEIRPAAPSDLGQIERIERESFGDDAFTRRQLAYLITRAKGVCFVALAAGKVAGYLSLLERPRFANMRIYSVATAPEARGLGIGQALLDKAVEYARERNAREITLEVSTANTAALALYRKRGFSMASRLPGYYHDGTDAWRMKCILPPAPEAAVH